jgi:hypothetical protein
MPLPEFEFPFKKTGEWPNEIYNVTIFSAYSDRTINGTVNSLSSSLGTSNRKSEDKYYYFLKTNMLSTEDIIIYPEERSPTPDDPHGRFFSLVLTHENTVAMSFSYLPIILHWMYPIILLFIIIVDICVVVAVVIMRRFKKIGYPSVIESPITIGLSLLVTLFTGTLFTLRFWIKDFLPPWEGDVYASMDLFLIWVFGVIMFTILMLSISQALSTREKKG